MKKTFQATSVGVLTAALLGVSMPPATAANPIDATGVANAYVNSSESFGENITLPNTTDQTIWISTKNGEIGIRALNLDPRVHSVVSDELVKIGEGSDTSFYLSPFEDGFQVVGVVANSSAPTDFEFEVLGEGIRLEMMGDGVAIYGTDGALLGGFTPPWAKDSKGGSVSTAYHLDGNTVIQKVFHRGLDATDYPIVFDPAYSSGVLAESWAYGYQSGHRISATLSAWGRLVHQFSTPTFAVESWNLLYSNHWQVRDARWINSLRQQWDCHIAGGVLEWGTWDIETTRPSNPNWRDRILTYWHTPSLVCNW